MSVVLWVVLAVVIVGVVIAAVGWDRYRGNQRTASNGDAWQPTSEVFLDPETGRRTRVWYEPTTGKRVYRPE
ncbi:MAG: hypothetical protein ACRDYY_00505 [Acidimicrobiales bacterium]